MNDTKTKVIRAGFLLADPDMERKSGQSVLIEGERIKAVSGRFIDPPPGGELIYLRKKFVLPGLIDCHVHLTAQLDRGYRLRTVEDSDPKVGFNATHNAAVTLTAVSPPCATSAPVIPRLFSHCGPPSPRERWRDRGFSASAPLSRPLAVMARSMTIATTFALACNQPWEFATASTNVAGRCAGTGGVLSIKAGLDQQFAEDEIRSIIETAHRPGRRVAVHAHGAADINAALEAGVDSIEHGSFLDARSLELFIAKGAFHVPTIIAGATVLEMAQDDGLLTAAQIEKAMIVGVKVKEALARSLA
jgi:imidazolonepropionase-like amidohydrolase